MQVIPTFQKWMGTLEHEQWTPLPLEVMMQQSKDENFFWLKNMSQGGFEQSWFVVKTMFMSRCWHTWFTRWPDGVLELVRVELASMWLCRRANHSTHLFPWNLARASDLLENFAGKILEAANEDQDHQSREWIHDERINVGFSTECRVLPIICMGKGFLLALCSM